MNTGEYKKYDEWPMPEIEHTIAYPNGKVVHRDFVRMRKWDGRYLRILDDGVVGVRSWSKDPLTEVGAGLVTPHNRLAVVGFNGFPAPMYDLPERYQDRAFKHRWVQHAERNVLDLAPAGMLDGYTMYVTSMPCTLCAGTMLSRGIKRVVGIKIDYENAPPDDWRHYIPEVLGTFRRCGVEYAFYLPSDIWASLEKSVGSEEDPEDDIPF